MCLSQKCYPSGNAKLFSIIGYILLTIGIILLFVSLPGWVWVALIGVALIVAGFLLLRLSTR